MIHPLPGEICAQMVRLSTLLRHLNHGAGRAKAGSAKARNKSRNDRSNFIMAPFVWILANNVLMPS